LKKHVVFYTAPEMDFSPATLSAVPIVIRGQALAAQRDGWDVAVACAKSANPLFQDIRTIPVDFSPAPVGGTALFFRRVERKLLQYRRVLHRRWVAESAAALAEVCPAGGTVVAPAEPEFGAALAACLPDRMFILVFHDCKFACKPRFRGKIVAPNIRLCAVSGFCARGAERYFSLQSGSVHTSYNAVDHELFSPQPRHVQERNIPLISYHGRSVPEKGIDILLEAAIRLAEAGLKFRLQLAGANRGLNLDLQDPFQKGLTAMLEQLSGLGVEVRRFGNVDFARLPEYIRSADIHVSPARWDEPFGMATLEAMACGLATVASNTGGTPELVGDAGLLFERESVEQLAAQLNRLILDEPFRREMSGRAREQSLKFTWEHSWRTLRSALGENAL
jgi:glycosyltransferase involved in cell wall biosynthesis